MTTNPDVITARWLWPTQQSFLAGVILAGPDLPGAACAGSRAYLFDDRQDLIGPAEKPTVRSQRHEAAQRICWTECPVRAACLAARLADKSLGSGVWGGKLFTDAPFTRVCTCGVTFTTVRRHQLYCGEPCRRKYQERRRRGRRAQEVAA